MNKILHNDIKLKKTKEEMTNITNNEKRSERKVLIGDFVFTFVFTFFLLIAAMMVIFKLAGYTMLNVTTGSMEPNYPINSLIFVKETVPSKIKEGDVISFVIDDSGTLVTHRVVAVHYNRHTFTTKGDANNTEDAEVLWDNVIGKVKFKIPKIGYLFMMVTAKQNRTMVIGIIAILIAGSSVFEGIGKIIRKSMKKNEKHKKK